MSPAEHCFAIAPSDSEDLAQATKAIYVGTGGDLSIVPLGSNDPVILRNVIGGSVLDLRIRAIRESGTTAADLVGLA